MTGIMNAIGMGAVRASIGAKSFLAGEVRNIKNDESGMELVQIVLLILFAIIIAIAIWYFLGDAIAAWFDTAGDGAKAAQDAKSTDLYSNSNLNASTPKVTRN